MRWASRPVAALLVERIAYAALAQTDAARAGLDAFSRRKHGDSAA